jgi:flavin-dependent dehydrogenase
MDRKHDYDVVVVGARCAGAATALLAARSGLSVLLIDRAPYGSDTLSTHALTLPGVLQLSRWGLLDEVRESGTPKVTQVVYDYDGTSFEIPIKPRGDVDGLYAPRRQVLDRVLVDAAQRAGADVRHRVRATDLVMSAGRVAGVVMEDASGAYSATAKLVVGADGARSPIARRVGAKTTYTAPRSTATIYTYAAGLPDDAYWNHFVRGAAVGIIPTNDRTANLWVSVPMSHLRSLPPGPSAQRFDRLLAAAPQLAAKVGAARPGQRHWTFTGMRGFARQCWGPGWALVGDAAYFKDPISAHGMTDALIAAELLAQQVGRIAAGEQQDSALAEYARLRWQLIEPMIPAIETAATLDGNMTALQQSHRTMNRAMHAEWALLTALGSTLAVSV